LVTDPFKAQAVAALSRGHSLFAGGVIDADVEWPARVHVHADQLSHAVTRLPAVAAVRTRNSVRGLRRWTDTDRAAAGIIAAARAEHAHASTATRTELDAARADAMPAADTPTGVREANARMAARLRAQHRHIVRSRSHAQLAALRLRRLHHAGSRLGTGGGRAAVLAAIRKALDIKGIHDPAARARWERGMDLVARRESNYTAGARNNWDSNAARGTPSRGVWQFTEPTFAAYHEPGTSPRIHSLLSQACAFINYARGHYGVAADASNLADRIQQADPRRAPRGY
jgi:SLT domain-containing protein